MQEYIYRSVLENHYNMAWARVLYAYDNNEEQVGFKGSPRYYHNYMHAHNIVQMSYVDSSLRAEEKVIMEFAALYHDAVYDVKSNTNEEDSKDFFLRECELFNNFNLSQIDIDKICSIILATKTHTATEGLERKFCEYDLAGFKKPFSEILADEKLIRKEYDFVDWILYQNGRISILEKFKENEIIKGFGGDAKQKIEMQIEYLKQTKPKIGVYFGSFNPFHKGHLNILEKAEQIIDKVIIAYGKNPDKDASYPEIPKELEYRQVERYQSSQPLFLKSLGYPVTVIRGLRNTTDMQAELNQLRVLQQIMSEFKSVNIFCDKEYEIISSSIIKSVKPFEDLYEWAQEFIVK